MAWFAHLAYVGVYQPIYNILALLVDAVPGADVGLAIVILTIIIRLILFPLSLAAIKSQIAMRRIDPELKEIREKYKDNKEELGRRTVALFKDNNINPLAGVLLLLIQLPLVLGLYYVVRSEAKQISFDPSVLYGFVQAPAHASLLFLGEFDLAGKSLLLAAAVVLSQFIYARLLAPAKKKKSLSQTNARSFQEDFTDSLQLQMQYVFPVIFGIIAYIATAAVALYFVTSNVFSIVQELVIQKLHGKR